LEDQKNNKKLKEEIFLHFTFCLVFFFNSKKEENLLSIIFIILLLSVIFGKLSTVAKVLSKQKRESRVEKIYTLLTGEKLSLLFSLVPLFFTFIKK
jgi:hypothetical protein